MTHHKVTITEISTASDGAPVLEREVYRQEFTEIDFPKVVQQLNARPRSKRKARSTAEK